MRTEDEVTLSFYQELHPIGDKENVTLVRHIETGLFCVRKTLSVFDRSLYLALQQMQVPGIPQIYHVVEDADRLIVIEEYINGRSLADWLTAHGPMSPADATDLIRQLCRILRVLHQAAPPIIHRDIKPENILLTPGGTVYLIDFNASKQFDPEKRRDTILMGTMEYAAPEQFGFQQSDARTDIYALGVLLNVLLTGAFPKDKRCNGRLSAVVEKCTSLDPEARYPSVTGLEHALSGRSEHPWYLLPGFRTGRPWKIALAIPVYLLMLYFSVTLELEDEALMPFLLWANRVALLILMLAPVLLAGNYQNVQDRLSLSRISHLPVRILVMVFWYLCLVAVVFTVLLTLESTLAP